MQPSGECPERLALGQKLCRSMEAVYAIRSEYDTAREAKADYEQSGRLFAALRAARQEVLSAERVYREHVETHACLTQPQSGDGAQTPSAGIRIL